jgi:hypothetical protein
VTPNIPPVLALDPKLQRGFPKDHPAEANPAGCSSRRRVEAPLRSSGGLCCPTLIDATRDAPDCDGELGAIDDRNAVALHLDDALMPPTLEVVDRVGLV